MTMLPHAARLFEHLPRTLRRHRLMTGWMRLTGEDPVQLTRIREDLFAYVDMSDGFRRLSVIDGEFEPDFFVLADAVLADGGVFFDIGANHGLFSFGLAGESRQPVEFHLFEANTVLVDRIRRTLPLYPAMRCILNAVAVSERSGSLSFLIDAAQSGISHVVPDGGVPVPSISLDDYRAATRIERVDLAKIDVEGHELAVVRGAMQSLASTELQAVYFEYCEKWLAREHRPLELIEFIESLDYRVCFCRRSDLNAFGGATHTFRPRRGRPVAVRPVAGHAIPATTDLLAVPRQQLAAHA